MDRPRLKLVGGPRPPETPRPHRGLALGIAAAVLGSGAAATAVGVERARHPIEPRETARRALELSLERGSDDSQVREMLLELRSSLGRRPLDSSTRVVYAALLLNLGRQLSDRQAAAHHALRAADLAPVTVPIQRLSVLTLTRTGDTALALSRIRDRFRYDAGAAAALLGEVEAFVEPSVLEDGLADDPDAWCFVAARKVRDGEWDALEELLPRDRDLGDAPQAAPPLIYRARLKTARGDADGALDDIRRALAISGESNLVRILAGDAFEALGDYAAARRHWNRALFDVPPDETTTRRNVLARLARLEERHGRPAIALRHWQSVLELEPSHAEALRRVRALTVFDR
jgi:hypothetical protein